MSLLNANGHVLVASAAGVAELWDLLSELAARASGDPDAGPTIHALGTYDERRYCLHPDSAQDFELRDDDLHELLLRGAVVLAGRLDPDDVWRRE